MELSDKQLVGKASVLIQGFGAVGTSLAYYLESEKIAKVVGISDKDGFIHSSQGLNIKRLLDERKSYINQH